MQKELIVQGRFITEEHILQITEMIAGHPQYSLSKLSRELCHIWNWRNHKGVLRISHVEAFLQSWRARDT